MAKLEREFRKWWKGERIVQIRQGDNNLIAMLSYDKKFFDGYNVGVYQRTDSNYPPEKFRLIEKEEGMPLTKAHFKFNKIVTEF